MLSNKIICFCEILIRFVNQSNRYNYLTFQEHPEKLDHFGRVLLHGKGYDRWFDKSFNLCIGNNGRVSTTYFFLIIPEPVSIVSIIS